MNRLTTLLAGACVAFAAVAQQTAPSLRITLKDGTQADYILSEIEQLTFVTDGETPVENAINIEVTSVTINSIKAKFSAANPAFTYVFGLSEKTEFDAAGGDDAFIQTDLDRLKADADSWWMEFTEYLDFLLGDWDADGQMLNRDNLKVNTPYIIYAYGLDTTGKVTSPLFKTEVSTLDLLHVDFNLSVDPVSSTTATIKANPDNTDTYYYLGFIARSEFENAFAGDKDAVTANALATVRMSIGSDGSKLDQVPQVRKGAGEQPLAGLTPGTDYYAIAFAIDATVSVASETIFFPFSTTAVQVTDPCTFDLTAASVEPMFINVNVKPTDAATRYFVTIRTAADAATQTPEQVADNEVAFQNGFYIDWNTDPRVFTGEQTLNSRRNLGVTIVKPESEFVVYAFGVSTQGVRTTAVSTLNVVTPAATASDMTIEISGITAGAESDPNDWSGWGPKICNFTYTVTPSVDNEYYYTSVVKKSDYEAFADDAAFMADVIATAGDYLMMNCFMGTNNASLSATPAPFKITADYKGASLVSGETYYVIAFGYAGAAVTPLFKQEATADDGSGSSSGGDWGWGR